MIPIQQTITTVPGGNCFQACVASIFEQPLDSVPNFLDGAAGDSYWTDEQWNAVRAFASSHGARAEWIDPDTEKPDDLEASDLYYIATGPSRRYPQFHHCVVMHKGQFVHDPLPAGGFLSGPPTHYIFFVPEDGG